VADYRQVQEVGSRPAQAAVSQQAQEVGSQLARGAGSLRGLAAVFPPVLVVGVPLAQAVAFQLAQGAGFLLVLVVGFLPVQVITGDAYPSLRDTDRANPSAYYLLPERPMEAYPVSRRVNSPAN